MRRYFFLIIIATVALAAQAEAWIRINQLGYLPQSTKVAVIMCQDVTPVTEFQLVDNATGKVAFTSKDVTATGALQFMKSTYRLNFSSFQKPGTYRINVKGVAQSPAFNISTKAYDGTADFLLNYMRQQRCGFNPFTGDSCHQKDAYIK